MAEIIEVMIYIFPLAVFLASAAMFYYALRSIRAGSMTLEDTTWSRARNPVCFWISIIFCLLTAASLALAGIPLLGIISH